MSRNLGDTSCRVCRCDRVRLEEVSRQIAESDTGPHLFEIYRGKLNVAAASCTECGAKYLAWVSVAPRSSMDSGHWHQQEGDERPFVDLSFRSTFDDEPGPEDLPSQEVTYALHFEEYARRARALRAEAAAKAAEAAALDNRATLEAPFWERYR